MSDTADQLIAYLQDDGTVTDWNGIPLGRYEIVKTWRTWRGNNLLRQVRVQAHGAVYSGRMRAGSTIFEGKRIQAPGQTRTG
jgi:hypothetical protein